MQYQTIAGRRIELDSLSPFEKSLFLGQLNFWIGLSKILYLDLEVVEKEVAADEKDKLPDVELFRDTWNMLLRNRVSEADRKRIQNGPLGTIISDLMLRIGIIKHRWKKDFIQHDPRWLLRQLRAQGSLTEFASSLGLDQGQASRALTALSHDSGHGEQARRKQVHLAISTLRAAATKLGVSFDYVQQDQVNVSRPVSCRDYHQQAFGTRISFLANVLGQSGFSHEDIEHVLYLEFKARTGEPVDAIRPLLSLIQNYPKFSAGELPKEKICAFEISANSDFKNFVETYAWMIFALEFHWFEFYQWIPLILDSDSAEFWRSRGMEIKSIEEVRLIRVEKNPQKLGALADYYE